MSISVGDKPVMELNFGGQVVREVYQGSVKIWPDEVTTLPEVFSEDNVWYPTDDPSRMGAVNDQDEITRVESWVGPWDFSHDVVTTRPLYDAATGLLYREGFNTSISQFCDTSVDAGSVIQLVFQYGPGGVDNNRAMMVASSESNLHFAGVAQPDNNSSSLNMGPIRMFVDGAEIGTTRQDLYDAVSDGGKHVVEFRDIDLSIMDSRALMFGRWVASGFDETFYFGDIVILRSSQADQANVTRNFLMRRHAIEVVPPGFSYGLLVQEAADGLTMGGSQTGLYGAFNPQPTPVLTEFTVDQFETVILRNVDGVKYGEEIAITIVVDGLAGFVVDWDEPSGQYTATAPAGTFVHFKNRLRTWLGCNFTAASDLPLPLLAENAFWPTDDDATMGGNGDLKAVPFVECANGVNITAIDPTGPIYEAAEGLLLRDTHPRGLLFATPEFDKSKYTTMGFVTKGSSADRGVLAAMYPAGSTGLIGLMNLASSGAATTAVGTPVVYVDGVEVPNQRDLIHAAIWDGKKHVITFDVLDMSGTNGGGLAFGWFADTWDAPFYMGDFFMLKSPSTGDRVAVENYLMEKHGIGGNLVKDISAAAWDLTDAPNVVVTDATNVNGDHTFSEQPAGSGGGSETINAYQGVQIIAGNSYTSILDAAAGASRTDVSVRIRDGAELHRESYTSSARLAKEATWTAPASGELMVRVSRLSDGNSNYLYAVTVTDNGPTKEIDNGDL